MRSFVLACLIAVTSASPGMAHGFKNAAIEIEHPFLRETPPGAKTGAGYMIIRNKGDQADRLLRIETEAAERVEFHQSVVEDGIAKMRPIEGGLEIPAGGEFRLGADGSHAMLVGLTAPVGPGFLIDATLVFEKAGALPMTFEVEPAGTKLEDTEAHHEQ